MPEQVYLAVDLGASSGRIVAGLFDGSRLRQEDVARFDNGGVEAGGTLYWDYLRLWGDICRGLRAAAERYAGRIASLGIDTWGVDFMLLGRGDVPLGNPVHYRDSRCEGMLAEVLRRVPREEVFAQTGVQFMPINTLYQLMALRQRNSPLLDMAERLLMMPDLFNWLLTGVKTNEFTNATTTQFYDPSRRAWATDLLQRLDLPTSMLGEVIGPGTTLGPVLPRIAAETGLHGVKVVVPGTHDTASAVMAVPAAGGPGPVPNWCFISSGTWALMGVEVPQPVITPPCLRFNFTNEGGVGGTIRLLKNIAGLWLVQECRRVWGKQGRVHSWDELNAFAAAVSPLASLINPDDPSLMAPDDMPEAIRALCRRTGQPAPHDAGAVIRCAVESLAMKCRSVLAMLEELIGGRLETIHIVGGGTQNRQLCQATADACGRMVLAGPVEATAIGNVMIQAVAAGAVGSIAQAREVVRRSCTVETYEPKQTAAWDAAYERFQAMTTL